jgi:sec-independent protein translocase protein TatA
MGLFDSPSHVLIVLLVLVLLFGSAKLPKAAKSLGEAMRIFRKEAQKLHEDDTPAQGQVISQQQLAVPPHPVAQSQPVQPVAQPQPVHPVAQPQPMQPVAQPQPMQPVAPPQPDRTGQPG